jgi:hypothetical protein
MKELIISANPLFYHTEEQYITAFINQLNADELENLNTLSKKETYELFNNWLYKIKRPIARDHTIDWLIEIASHIAYMYDGIKVVKGPPYKESRVNISMLENLLRGLLPNIEYKYAKKYDIKAYIEYGKLIIEMYGDNEGSILEVTVYKKGKPVRFTLPDAVKSVMKRSPILQNYEL